MKYIKKLSYVSFFIVVSLIFLSSVSASYMGKITANGKIMVTESLKKVSGVSLNTGDLLTVLSDTKIRVGEGGCSQGYLKSNHQGIEGYVCANYIQRYSPSATCKNEIKKEGFPDVYVDYICSLKESHNNWIFKAINVGVDFSTVINKESECGKSLIQDTSLHNEWGWIDKSCSSKEGSFVAASQKGVAYAMDPRNFINEQYIFQFESLKYESSLESDYVKASKNMLSGADFYTYHLNKGTNIAEAVNVGGKDKNVNPVSLSSRMRNELGTGTTERDLYSGVWTGSNNAYYGYYNFYNIGVSGSCIKKYGRNMCGLDWAKDHGWNTVQKAVTGGAEFLASGYLNRGQYTSYLQKFNVVPTPEYASSIFLHQYMDNITAPKTEALISYNAYKNAGMLNNPFVFSIPVYGNMDATIENSSNGAVPDNNPTNPSTMAVNTMVTASGYKLSGSTISGINPTTSVDEIKNKIAAVGGTAEVSPASGNYVGTGSTIKVSNKDTSVTYKVVVKGDTSGDGQISALDLLQVQKHLLKTYSLSGERFSAGDTSGDGQISALDLLQVQKHLLRLKDISQ